MAGRGTKYIVKAVLNLGAFYPCAPTDLIHSLSSTEPKPTLHTCEGQINEKSEQCFDNSELDDLFLSVIHMPQTYEVELMGSEKRSALVTSQNDECLPAPSVHNSDYP